MMEACLNRKEIIRRGRVFDITLENVSLPNGACIDMEIIRHPGAAAIVPMTDNQEILMLKQYRYAIGRYWWEIPAGTFDGREEPLLCARRELTEETGFSAEIWEPLGAVTPVPGYSDERIHLFLARNLSRASQNLDLDEIIEVHALSIDQVLTMIINGELEDAKSIVAIFKALGKLGYDFRSQR